MRGLLAPPPAVAPATANGIRGGLRRNVDLRTNGHGLRLNASEFECADAALHRCYRSRTLIAILDLQIDIRQDLMGNASADLPREGAITTAQDCEPGYR